MFALEVSRGYVPSIQCMIKNSTHDLRVRDDKLICSRENMLMQIIMNNAVIHASLIQINSKQTDTRGQRVRNGNAESEDLLSAGSHEYR
jgi:hypothetical protein